MGQFGDVLKQGLTAAEGFGGDVVKGVGDIGGAIGKEAMALPGQVEGLFGMGKGAGATSAPGGPTGTSLTSVVPDVAKAADAPVASGVGAGAFASADPAAINTGAYNADIAKSLPNPDSLSTDLMANPNAVVPGASPVVAGAAVRHPQDALSSAMANLTNPVAGIQPAQPGAIQSLIHTLTQPDMLKMELPGALFGLNAIHAMQPTAQEKAMKSQLQHAEGQQSLTERQLAAEQSGQLPQTLQQGIDMKAKQAEAAIRQRYAEAGMSGSSAEAADIANAQAEAQVQAFQEAQSMVNQTAQLLGGYDSQVSQYLSSLSAAEMARDAALRNSIVGFLSAAGYGRPDDSESKHSTK